MRKIAFIPFIFFTASLYAQTCDTTSFGDAYWIYPSTIVGINKVLPAGNGQSYLLGSAVANITTDSALYAIFLAKLNERGTPLWAKVSGAFRQFIPADIQPCPSGGFFAAGACVNKTFTYSPGEPMIAKLDTSGNILWAVGFAKQPGSYNKVIPTADGGCIVAGFYYPEYTVLGPGAIAPKTSAAILLRYDADGNLLWEKNYYTNAQYANIINMIQMDDGNIVLSGQLEGTKYYIEKRDISDGHQIWSSAPADTIVYGHSLTGTVNPVLTSGNTMFIFDGSNGALLSKKSMHFFYRGYNQSLYYAGSLADNSTLFESSIAQSSQMVLCKISNDTIVNWIRVLSWATPYGPIGIPLYVSAAGNGIYLYGSTYINTMSLTSYGVLIKADENGKAICIDTLDEPLNIFTESTPAAPSFTWPNEYNTTNGETVPTFSMPAAMNSGPLCYNTNCCRDTIINTNGYMCLGGFFVLPNGDTTTTTGLYTIDLKRVTGCDSIINVTVGIVTSTKPNLGHDTCFTDAKPVVLSANAPLAQSYLWQDGSTDSFYATTTPGIYWVMATNACGSASDTVQIFPTCHPQLFIPSAFTPNGDGHNDVFRIPNMDGQHLINFTIYNRWGQMVFQTSNPSTGWDGTINGQPEETATFVYFLQYKDLQGKYQFAKGTVTLIR